MSQPNIQDEIFTRKVEICKEIFGDLTGEEIIELFEKAGYDINAILAEEAAEYQEESEKEDEIVS
jgi:hypothetical protein